VTSSPPGLLMVWTNIPEELEYDFNEWYNREHMRERILGVPGFVRGRRFVAFEGGPRYLAIYETRSAAVLHSEPYLALKRDYDPLSRRFVPNFLDTLKVAGEIVAHAGVAEGGVVVLVPIARTPGREDALREWIGEKLLPELLGRHGVVGAWYAERTAAAVASALVDHPRTTDRILDAVLMVEAVSNEDLSAAASLLDWDRMQAEGGKPDAPAARFRVVYTVYSPPEAGVVIAGARRYP
jgi:hypothetical protein